MNVKKLRIVCDTLPNRFTTVAVLYSGEDAWRDPHGGEFTPGEQAQFFAVAAGTFSDVGLGVGTAHHKVLDVYLAVDFI